MRLKKCICSLFCTAIISTSLIPTEITSVPAETAGADTMSYPVQEFRLGIGDTNRNLTLSGTDDGDNVSSYTFLGERSQKWYLNYISTGVYEIVSSSTGYVLTNDGGLAVISTDIDSTSQRWKIEAVAQDFEGYDLYYKITSIADGSALTFNPDSNSVNVDDYTGETYQKYKLNLDGLEGFAANSVVNGKEKAGTIGGLLGETVYADTVDEFITALDSTDPKTVVITADLDLVNQSKDKQRIRDNKTIIGSYSKNTVYDSQLRNDDFWGKDDRPSNNIVIKNVNWVGRTLNNTGSGTILLQFYGVRNLWIDHNNFSATFSQNKDAEVGKFIWINTPSESWSDGKYNSYNPDYITVSYTYFKNRYWTFAFGSQNKDTSRLHTTLMYNKWEQCSRRCPQYSNGYDHNYNNYHTVTGGSNPNKSSQVIGGEGSRVVNENCRFEGYKGNELDPDRNSSISFTDSGSYTSDSPSGTPSAISFKNHNTSEWKPADFYGYHLVEAYNKNGTDVKDFCNKYSGCFKTYNSIQYITDSTCADFVSKTFESPFLKSVEVGNEPVQGGKIGAVLPTQHNYAIVNSGSGLSIGLKDGTMQQTEAEYLWNLEDVGNGYYLITEHESGLVLTLADGSKDNGTALSLTEKNGTDAQLFKFVDNGDNTYTLATKISRDKSCLGIAMGSVEPGAAIVQWTCDESANQKWKVEARIAPIKGKLMALIPKDLNYYQNWKIAEKAQIGSLVFGDRDATYTELPNELLGAEYIQTACDSKNTAGDLAEVTANADMTLYVALDARVKNVPAWLSDWTLTELTATNSKDVKFRLYSREMTSGESVTLGTNGQSVSCVNYTIFAVKAAEKNVKGDVNMDGQLSVADVVLLQKWLLAVPDTHLANWKAADLCEDDKLDVFDLCLMKRELLNQ